MIEYLDKIDKILLLILNGNGDPYWDKFMWIYTGRFVWLPLLLTFLIYIYNKGWKEGTFMLLTIALVILLCDQISSSFFKPFFERPRPSRQEELDYVLNIVNGYRGGKFGFISSHAANSFGFAVFTSLIIRKRLYTISFIFWAMITSYSRVYLGVHFPGDILAGAMLGVLIGYLMYQFYEFMRITFGPNIELTTIYSPYKGDLPKATLWVLYITYVIMLIFTNQIYPFFLKH